MPNKNKLYAKQKALCQTENRTPNKANYMPNRKLYAKQKTVRQTEQTLCQTEKCMANRKTLWPNSFKMNIV